MMVLVAAVGLSTSLFKLIMKPALVAIPSEDGSYEMLRPEALRPKYDLSGRLVVRNTLPVPGVTNGVPMESQGAKTVSPVPVPAVRAPLTPQQVAAQKQAQADKKRKAALQAAEAKRKAQMAVRMAAPTQKPAMSPLARQAMSPRNPVVTNVPASPSRLEEPLPTTSADEKVSLSPGQWRSLLQAQPTLKHGADFFAGLQAGDVERGTYFLISRELMSDASEERQKLGLFLLKQVPSAESFMVLVSQYKDASQKEVYETLMTYSEASRLPFLKQVLASEDSRSIQMAVQIIAKVVDSQQPGKNDQMGRDLRGTRNIAYVPPTQLQLFIPVLEHLVTQSKKPEIAEQAQILKDKIRALKLA
jgi:hypothetical protein